MSSVSVPNLRQDRRALTPEQVKRRLADAGCTITAWAASNGYERELVSRVLSGACKAKYGKGHEVAVALGLKVPTTALAA